MVAQKTERRRRIGTLLRDARLGANLSQATVAARYNTDQPPAQRITQSFLSRVESGQAELKAAQLDRLLSAIGVDDSIREVLTDLHQRSDQPGWWEAYRSRFKILAESVRLGEQAISIKTYGSVFTPGLLQTSDYARAVIGSSPATRRKDVDTLLEVRLRRQQRLSAPGFRLTCVMGEATLHHCVGGRAVMRAQLVHLRDVAAAGQHTLRVLPYARGPWPGAAQFSIYTLADSTTVAAIDSEFGAQLCTDPDQLTAISTSFADALASALEPQETVRLLEHVIATI